MRIVLRNASRAVDPKSGYGVINEALLPLVDAVDCPVGGRAVGDGDVHLFASPPYSFRPVTGKFNVGLTMTERQSLKEYQFDFVGKCNAVDLLLVPSFLQKRIFESNGVRTPISVVLLGVDFDAWSAPVRDSDNRMAFIMDRGRDHAKVRDVVGSIMTVDYADRKSVISHDDLKRRYSSADILVKWVDRRGPGEGWCFPILEAMSSGCAVITNAELPYLVEGNHLPFRDEAGLREQLRSAASSRLFSVKQAGNATARSLSWGSARAVIRGAISGAAGAPL
jgi:hypothetical protein